VADNDEVNREIVEQDAREEDDGYIAPPVEEVPNYSSQNRSGRSDLILARASWKTESI
jgi:hypothetical protein